MNKKILSLFLSGLLWLNPIVLMAQDNSEEKLNQIYLETKDITFKKTLEIGLQAATTEKERNDFKKGLASLEKNPALGAVSIGESIDTMAYFFLNNLEKDFIAFPKSYQFYKGFRSVFRGQKFNYYNAKCVYNRSNAVPFNLMDFINGKYPCAAPKNYPKHLSKYKIIEGIEKGLTDLDKKVTINFYESGKSVGEIFLGFFIPNAHAITSTGKGIASVVLIAGGIVIVFAGVVFTPLAAIGIPIIALGCASVIAGLGMTGWSISDKIKKKRSREHH